tara:strand:+ start:2934 stop:3272 length:339 start_codon:yes stop_codon:yes gene_type:complete
MAATWKIINLDRQVLLDDKADVITNVNWQVTDSETVGSGDDKIEHHGVIYGSSGLDTSDLSSFITYADITEANAIAWAKAAIGADQVAAYEKSVADQITESKTPTEATGVPW